ncbi:T9SS type B sorting domain-containing protein [Aquimarina sp. MMG016]|uniref:T9SS type B sorting domain-containing protein n=1 Tax=Aquimarina sp. MMG016 TaxID=2822690 RepID=UPI001B3A0E57|nr:T9SS type B sorting domain-containing protein [Aquimarina sp. MMG016]MBQ4822397.1 T9SS type B sorting domain-containing protein [Aquimarina sp. MMG016]
MELPQYKVVILSLAFCITAYSIQAQLGFCNGNSGDSIFNEAFGTGTANGPELPAGTTGYTYVNGTPDDGEYTVSSFTGYFDWHNTQDHTPNDTNGKCLIFNADFVAGEFFRRTVTGLCENTSYEFSSWLLNLLPANSCDANGIPVNVRFQIWDNTDTNLLATGDTGDIFSRTSPVWEQYGLVFQTLPGQTSVILKMINNGNGGCGNDLAIDDIIFRTCGDFITIEDDLANTSITACEEDIPITTQLTAIPDFSIYNSHAYQWQQSIDGVNWIDISGETNQTYTPPAIITSVMYRVKVAEDIINLANPLCIALSEVFDIKVVLQPNEPLSMGNVSGCRNVEQIISVSVPDGIIVNWYDSDSGGTIVQSNSTSYQTSIPGTYYAEAISVLGDCVSSSRTAVSISVFEPPIVEDQELLFCSETQIILEAGISNVTYAWSTGETTSEITVDNPGEYTVQVTDANGCSSIKEITLIENPIPVIANIAINEDTVTIITANTGNFEYSLDGIVYQDNAVFTNLEAGLYTGYVRATGNCGIATQEFIVLDIPKYFTPNQDGVHDFWNIGGIENYPGASVYIFDRVGKLLKQVVPNDEGWNGTYLGRLMPSSEYWFSIDLKNGTIMKGHFSLIR